MSFQLIVSDKTNTTVNALVWFYVCISTNTDLVKQ